MELVIAKRAANKLRRIQPKTARAILSELNAIAADPFKPHRNVERLKGVQDGFRLRHGDWRILYRIDQKAGRMIVGVVKPRGEAYGT
jgi:mRNA interferase RelE/StbE